MNRTAIISVTLLIMFCLGAGQILLSFASYDPPTIHSSGIIIQANVIRKLLIAWGFRGSSPSQSGFLEHMAGFDMLSTSVEVASRWDELKIMKEINPSIIVLVYKDVMHMSAKMDDWNEVNQHEEWFLHDSSGDRLINKKFPDSYAMDVGNAGWREHYTNNIKQKCEEYGFDGVFADSVWSQLWKDEWTVESEKIPDYPEWHEQMIGFIAHVKSQIGSRLMILNAPNNGDYVDTADGKMEENFAFKQVSGQTPIDNIKNLFEISGRGKYYLAAPHLDPEDSQENMLFALGCFLLGVNGPNAYFSWRNVWSEPSHGYYPQMDKAEALGFPTNKYYSYQSVLARDFQNGKVLVNPSNYRYTVDLQGTYETLDGETLTGITMEGHTSAILKQITG